MNKKIFEHKLWLWTARIGPLVSLLAIGLCMALDLTNILEWVLYFTAILFGMIAFAWWFWIMDIAKDMMNLLDKANQKFEEIKQEVKDLKKDLNDR